MDIDEAKKMIESEGFTNVRFVEEEDGIYIFMCDDEGEEVSVYVKDGEIVVSPT